MRIAPVAETPKTSEQPPQPARQVVHCWLSLLLCCILAMLILPFLLIDISNNYHQGSRYLHELGLVMAVAAVAFAAVPMAAAFLGRWCWLTVGSTTVVGTVTVCAAYFAYTHAINVGIDSVVTMQAQNQTAREKRDAAQTELDAAQATLAGIAELMPSSALKRLYNNALERKAVESTPERGGCKPFIMVDGRRQDSLCRKAEGEAAEYLRRMGDAEAKEKAESLAAAARKKLAEVETAADVAPPTQELAAIDLAQTIGTTPEEAARLIARGFAIGSIIMTVFMALLSHLTTKLGMAAFGVLPLNKRKATVAPAPTGLQVVPPPDKPAPVLKLVSRNDGEKRSRKPLTTEERIALFISKKLRKGEGATQAQPLYDAFCAWWAKEYPGLPTPKINPFADGLKDAGIVKGKVKGKMVYPALLLN